MTGRLAADLVVALAIAGVIVALVVAGLAAVDATIAELQAESRHHRDTERTEALESSVPLW